MAETNWSESNPVKAELRSAVWTRLKEQQITRRDPFGHIPNFIGAAKAAEQLTTLPIWQQAQVIKCNPDSPQRPVRLRALQDGKRLYMAVPRLTRQRCFVELLATDLIERGISLEEASTMRQALIHGKLVSFEAMHPIDLVVVGCVAVAHNGGRTGKGAGFADLELAMLQSFGLVQATTPVVTTVHHLQVVESSQLPMEPHDWALNWIVTPEAVIATNTTFPRPNGLDWSNIRPEQYQKIPILRKLREELADSLVGEDHHE